VAEKLELTVTVPEEVLADLIPAGESDDTLAHVVWPGGPLIGGPCDPNSPYYDPAQATLWLDEVAEADREDVDAWQSNWLAEVMAAEAGLTRDPKLWVPRLPPRASDSYENRIPIRQPCSRADAVRRLVAAYGGWRATTAFANKLEKPEGWSLSHGTLLHQCSGNAKQTTARIQEFLEALADGAHTHAAHPLTAEEAKELKNALVASIDPPRAALVVGGDEKYLAHVIRHYTALIAGCEQWARTPDGPRLVHPSNRCDRALVRTALEARWTKLVKRVIDEFPAEYEDLLKAAQHWSRDHLRRAWYRVLEPFFAGWRASAFVEIGYEEALEPKRVTTPGLQDPPRQRLSGDIATHIRWGLKRETFLMNRAYAARVDAACEGYQPNCEPPTTASAVGDWEFLDRVATMKEHLVNGGVRKPPSPPTGEPRPLTPQGRWRRGTIQGRRRSVQTHKRRVRLSARPRQDP
jgi:hypothetical protein